MSKYNPFTRYAIYLEEILTPQKRFVIIQELANKGWIHTNISYVQRRENSFLEISCTPELLGKVVNHLMKYQIWVMVEKIK